MAESVRIETVGLEKFDQCVKDWLDRTVDAHVDFPNGERRKVPIVFAAGERAITSRQRKGMRDKNGVLILPIISVRRTGIDPQPNMQALGTEVPNMVVAKRLTPKTSDMQNLNRLRDPSLRTPTKPIVYEVTTIPFPDRNILNYELVIHTQYITQMNSIIEKLFHELDIQKSFVMPFQNDHRHAPSGDAFEKRKPLDDSYAVGFFEETFGDSSNFEEFTDQERIVKYSTNFRVPGTLQLDPEGERPSVQKEYTSFGLAFGEENVKFVDDPLELELIFGSGKVREPR